jgi:hypothetical protein
MAFEGFELEFTRDGVMLPVTDIVPGEGVILGGEIDNWPLGVALQLEPLSPGTRVIWERIQRDQGWFDAHTFRFKLSRSGERLRFEGIRPDLLPSGTYRGSVFVSGYRFHTRVLQFTIPPNESVHVPVPEKPERRQITRIHPLDDFDPLTRQIVEQSRIDGISLDTWLRDNTRRIARQAAVLNLLAKLRTPIGSNPPLSEAVIRLIFADIDRVYAELVPGFADRFEIAESGFGEDRVVHTTHLKLLRRIPNGSGYHLESFRQQTPQLSLQVAVAVPDRATDLQYADIDIDLGNPFTTPLGFFIHLGELLDPGKTDHLAVFDDLCTSPVNDFLYYELARP